MAGSTIAPLFGGMLVQAIGYPAHVRGRSAWMVPKPSFLNRGS
jgi:hypothetical protein